MKKNFLKVVIVGAAPLRGTQARKKLKAALRDKQALKLAVDGGLELCLELGVEPHLYVGDLDSVKRVPENLPAVFLPKDKSYSDLKAALEVCQELGADEVEAWAVTGGRPDHHWASVGELSESSAQFSSLHAEGEDGSYHWVKARTPLTLKVKRGSTVSLFNLDSARGIQTQGLQYNLKNETLRSGSHGLSNQARSADVRVSVKRGSLLVVLPA